MNAIYVFSIIIGLILVQAAPNPQLEDDFIEGPGPAVPGPAIAPYDDDLLIP
jgi:hypothetical protein